MTDFTGQVFTEAQGTKYFIRIQGEQVIGAALCVLSHKNKGTVLHSSVLHLPNVYLNLIVIDLMSSLKYVWQKEVIIQFWINPY